MQTIHAKVNSRLLTKAPRLFTGTLSGRIIELLQNARRAGATIVEITNGDGVVTVRDNGRGVEDFSVLLDLGGSDWEQRLEASEDPGGVGVFSLAPRRVVIRSKGKMAVIEGDGWSGAPVIVERAPEAIEGTELSFLDEPWNHALVEVSAVFSGLRVIVEGQACASDRFVSAKAADHPTLGCRIEVRSASELTEWHRMCCLGESVHSANVLVNFHGQVVAFHRRPVSDSDLHYLIDLTGEPTGIRLMLPARTQLVENEAYAELLEAIEQEAYRYIQRTREHTLPYSEYLRAEALGIPIPEAVPDYHFGLITSDLDPQPIRVIKPEDFPLAQCYRLDPECVDEDFDTTNAHLLAAIGTFQSPFVPVDIHPRYEGYSWAKLPTITKVELSVGRELRRDYVWAGNLTCVESLRITARTSDGKVFSSPVCMARKPVLGPDGSFAIDEDVLVTPEAENRLDPTVIWYHLGGWREDGDTYDSQEYFFTEELNRFWADLVGPDEHLRQRLVSGTGGIKPKWRSVTLYPDGKVSIQRANGTEKTLVPPGVDGRNRRRGR